MIFVSSLQVPEQDLMRLTFLQCNPVLGYETCTKLAKEALERNIGVYDLVIEKKLLTIEKLNELLKPENMINPQRKE